ncbi:hypothetical protein LLH00_13440, partial [bacterium]|nr:hypothetical protein [bacterium]
GPNLLYEVGPEDYDDSYPSGYSDYSDLKTSTSRRANRWMYRQTHTYRLPTVLKLALSYNLLTSEKANWLATGEIWRNSNIPLSYATGTELNYNFTQFISGALRLGWLIQTDEYTEDTDAFGYKYWGDDPTLQGLSFGGGMMRKVAGRTISFNYAYRNKGRLSADNFFTVSLGF